MTAERVLGANEFTELAKRRELVGGVWKVKRRWEGPQALLDAKTTEVVDEIGRTNNITADEGVPAVIESTSADMSGDQFDPAQQAEDSAVWELLGQDLEKPIGTHPYFEFSPGATPGYIEQADEAIRKGTARGTDWSAIDSHLQEYVNLRLVGVDTYISFSYIVRKTITFADEVLIWAEFGGNANMTPGQVITWDAIQIPAKAHFQKPSIHEKRYGTSEDVPVDQWLVKSPQVRWTKGKKLWELTREWWGAVKWSQALYDGGTYSP